MTKQRWFLATRWHSSATYFSHTTLLLTPHMEIKTPFCRKTKLQWICLLFQVLGTRTANSSLEKHSRFLQPMVDIKTVWALPYSGTIWPQIQGCLHFPVFPWKKKPWHPLKLWMQVAEARTVERGRRGSAKGNIIMEYLCEFPAQMSSFGFTEPVLFPVWWS